MSNELFKEFVQFCKSHPSDKEIDHWSWKTCAVGKFARSIGIPTGDDDLYDDFADELFEGIQQLRELVNLCPTMAQDYNDYGKFTALLERHL